MACYGGSLGVGIAGEQGWIGRLSVTREECGLDLEVEIVDGV